MAQELSAKPVWDLPVRLFHWLLPVGLASQWYSIDQGWMETHETVGKLLLILVLFRILWGFFGSETARFAHFLRGPSAVLGQIRGGGRPPVGHDAAGGWMIVLLLAALFAQAVMGLFGVDDIGLFYGPLSGLVSASTSEMLTHWHHRWSTVILVLVGLHLFGVFWYSAVRRERLVRPMITGRKPVAVAARMAPPGRAVLLLALAALVVEGTITALQTLA